MDIEKFKRSCKTYGYGDVADIRYARFDERDGLLKRGPIWNDLRRLLRRDDGSVMPNVANHRNIREFPDVDFYKHDGAQVAIIDNELFEELAESVDEESA